MAAAAAAAGVVVVVGSLNINKNTQKTKKTKHHTRKSTGEVRSPRHYDHLERVAFSCSLQYMTFLGGHGNKKKRPPLLTTAFLNNTRGGVAFVRPVVAHGLPFRRVCAASL